MNNRPPPNKAIHVSKQAGILCITYKWYNVTSWMSLVLSMCFTAYMIYLGTKHSFVEIIFSPFGVIFLCLSYVTLADFLNATEILVGNGKISVKHGPLPWIGNKTIDTSLIQNLFYNESKYRAGGVSSKSIFLIAALKNGKKQNLVSGWSVISKEDLLYLKQLIENHLGR